MKMEMPSCLGDKVTDCKKCCKRKRGRPMQMILKLLKTKVKKSKKKKREDDSRRWRCQVASETK